MSKNILKEFGLTNFALRSYNTVKVLIAILAIGGLLAYIGMPREAFPTVAAPEVFVSTPYPGNSAEDIEALITRPLELELKKISGVDEIKSTSKSGFSSIDIKFDFNVDPDKALSDVKDKIDEVAADKDWPSDVPSKPKAMKLDFSEMMPIMNINISGNYKSSQLKKYAEILQDKIEQLPEVSAADIRGVQDMEVEVAVDLNEMLARNINFRNIENAIKNNNLNISAGDIIEDGVRRNLRVTGEISDPRELYDIIIRKAKDKVVYLRDVATVRFKQQRAESYAREFGKTVVMLDVKKRSGANQIEAADKIKKIIEETKKVFPGDINVNLTNDLSDRTRKQVASLENSIIFGMLLVIFVLMFFLGFRNALFVGVAIPLSMMMSFLILSAFGVTLNTMVLFALVLALGMLVDNGIVIIENIYRYREEGYGSFESAKYAVGEVAWPIITSTLTTLVAFLPLAFWPGIIGEFMRYLPVTLIVVLSSSLFVALVINPVLAMLYMKLDVIRDETSSIIKRTVFFAVLSVVFFVFRYAVFPSETAAAGLMNALGLWFAVMALWQVVYHFFLVQAIEKFQNNFLPLIEDMYRRTIEWTLSGKRAWFVFLSTVALLVISIVSVALFPPKTEFFPDPEPNQVYVYIEFPESTDINVVNDFTRKITSKIDRYLEENGYKKIVRSIVEQVGEGTSDPRRNIGGGKTPNRSKIMLDFVPFEERDGISSRQIMRDLQEMIKGYAGIKISVDKDQHKPPMGAPIEMKLLGDDYDELLDEANKIKKYIDEAGIPGIENLVLDVDKNLPELELIIDKEKAGRYGVSVGQIGMQLRTAVYGKEADTYKAGDDDYPINIRLTEQYRNDRSQLLNQRIVYRDQQSGKLVSIPISALAVMRDVSSFSSIKRRDLKRVITFSSNVLAGYNANEIIAGIQKLMEVYDLPRGMSYTFEGEQKEMKKNMAFLSRALMIAVFMILLILVTQFNSLKTPVIIMVTVLLSMIGVFLGLLILRSDFIVVMTMIGIISLAGIVVNNAIVLIDYTNLTIDRLKRENGIPKDENPGKELIREALIHAGKTRLRPVLLTAITTILGLVPLAIGLNIDFIKFFTEFNPDIYTGGENTAFWGPLATAVINGLTFATFLTLVVVPAMYYIMFGRDRKAQEEPA
jgi:multidrug efflux pump subunit AcrB